MPIHLTKDGEGKQKPMCGILGSINQLFDKATLDLIEHRGPDDFGINSFTANGHKVRFGQRRLAIIDLSPAGHQPMVSPCEDFALIFNGEIYNHLDLRKKLPSSINYKGHSDTETILHYLIHFGPKAIADFNGIFAIAFLDLTKGELTLARDPFGVKPLYYFEDDNRLIFSSEIRPIQSILNTNELNAVALASLLRLRYNASPDTLYSKINKLPPGYILTVNMKSRELLSSTYNYTKALPSISTSCKQELLKAYGETLEASVKRQLLADVEVGILLSGGVDSAVIAALAKKHYKGTIKAFTIGFEGDVDEDEIADARQTAQILGLEHHVKKISFSDFLGLIKECSRIVEEPLATTSMIPMYYLAKLASEKVKVVLTGQGADEPLGGYSRYRAEVIRSKVPKAFHGIINPMVKLSGSKNEQLLRGARSIGIENEIERFLSVYEIFSQEEIQHLISNEDTTSAKAVLNFHTLLDCNSRKHAADKMMAIDTRMNLADDLLNYTDKITMNFSLECRVPMLDVDFVHFMETLPTSLKLNTKEGKLIHKQFAERILPDEIIYRKKKGFQSPTNRWFREEMQTVENILLTKDSEFALVFNQNYISEILKQHSNGYNREKQIFLLLSIYYWFEANKKVTQK